MLILIFHAVCAFIYCYTIKFDYELTVQYGLQLPIQGVFLSKFVWLTMINLYLQGAYHIFACLLRTYEKVKRNARTPKTNSSKIDFHKYSTTLVFPLAMTVVLLFWGLYFFDPSFLMDESAKRILAITWYNHAIHTFPAFAMILDHALWKHARTKKITAFVIIFVFVCIYLAGVHYVHFVYGFWAYPILGELSTPNRLIFIACCTFVIFAAFLAGDLLLQKVHPAGGRPTARRSRKLH